MENEFDTNTVDITPVGNDKLYAILSYISILWLLGLLIEPEKNHAFVKNHVNNGIWLTILSIACSIIPIVGWIASIAVLVFWVMGLVNACTGKTFTIPVIGEKLPAFAK